MATPTDQPVLEQLREMMKEMKEVKESVNRSETNTSTKIDSLSKSVSDRLNKAELSVKCLAQDVATVKTDLNKMRKKADDSGRIERIVGEVMDRRMAAAPRTDLLRRPRPSFLTGANLTPALKGPDSSREDDYWLARRTRLLMPQLKTKSWFGLRTLG